MDKILVIEDEPLERIALCGNIRRIYGDSVEIFQAEDGTEALDICMEQTPDIAVVDINIPGITGLELIQVLTQQHFAGKVIILTAYDTSGYIRKALSLGVSDYLLKPAASSELKKAFDKCFAALDKERRQIRETRMQSAMSYYTQTSIVNDILNGQPPEKLLTEVYDWPENEKLSSCLLRTEAADAFREELDKTVSPLVEIFTSELGGKFLAILQCTANSGEDSCLRLRVMLQSFISMYESKHAKAAIEAFGPLVSYTELREAVAGGGKTLQHLYHTLGDSEDLKRLSRKWEKKLRERNAESFVKMLKRRMVSNGNYWGHVSLLISVLASFDETVNLNDICRIFAGDRPYVHFQSWLQKEFENTQNAADRGQDEIAHILSWMEEHYMEDISRQDAAREAGLSETYFSNQFSQKTGTTFVNSLNRIRIIHAQEKMQAGEKNLKEIAASCGFYNHRYFLDVFRKYTGRSVTEYIREIEGGENRI